MIIFETERLLVRNFSYPDDQENFFLLHGDEEVMRYIRPAKTREESDAFLKMVIAESEKAPLLGRWAVNEKLGGKFAGSYAFIPVENTGEFQLGYALLKDFWGKGYATELMKSGIVYAFSNSRLDTIYGITEAANLVSKKVLLKTGFSIFSQYKEGEKEICKFRLLKGN